MIELTEDDIQIIEISNFSQILINSINHLLYPKKDFEQLKQQILENQELRKKIVDLADIWDGVESMKYGKRLLDILDNLGIKDVPEFYSKENMDSIMDDIDESIKNKQNQKLRELIEKRIEEISKYESPNGVFNNYVKTELQKLLEESKK